MDPDYYNTSTDATDATDIINSTNVANQLYNLENGDNLEQLQNNQERLIKIDRFYVSKYKAQNYILQQIVFFCCLALIGAILYNKQMITLTMFNVYLLLLFIALLYYAGRSLFNIILRDNHNFDEYDYAMLNNPNFDTPNKTNGKLDLQLSDLPSCHI